LVQREFGFAFAVLPFAHSLFSYLYHVIYPKPLSNEYWTKRGRWIPSVSEIDIGWCSLSFHILPLLNNSLLSCQTPWDSVWNSVAQWMGVHDDADLDFVLPNRNSFDMCNTLFTDKDLFVDGACQCIEENGIQSTVCDDTTYSPTLSPTESPSSSPTGNPSSSPTPAPTKSPSGSPTLSPSTHPTADLPDDGELAANIFAGHNIKTFGCVDPNKHLDRVFDGETDKLSCAKAAEDKTLPISIIVSPEHRRPSIVKGLRLYAPSNGKGSDCVSYTLEGRLISADDTAPWNLMHQGDFPWKGGAWSASDKNRNANGLQINSTYADGDPSLTWTGVKFHSHGAVYDEYKFTCDETRTADNSALYISELEFVGMLLPAYPSASPTLSPSTSPTPSPTRGPTVSVKGAKNL
jgi:hypothetical protein